MYIGCGCVIVGPDDRYLLVQESKAIARGRMALPAGKLEPNETLEQAAVREANEETGLVVEIDALLGIYHCAMTTEGSFGVNFVYLAHVTGGAIRTSDEHPVVEWHTATEIAALAAQGRIRGTHVLESVTRHQQHRHLDRNAVTQVLATPSS